MAFLVGVYFNKKGRLLYFFFLRSQRIVNSFPWFFLRHFISKHASAVFNKHRQVLKSMKRFLRRNILVLWVQKLLERASWYVLLCIFFGYQVSEIPKSPLTNCFLTDKGFDSWYPLPLCGVPKFSRAADVQNGCSWLAGVLKKWRTANCAIFPKIRQFCF